MTARELLADLRTRRIRLAADGDNLRAQGDRAALRDPTLMALLREHKAELLALLRTGADWTEGEEPDAAAVPPALIPPGAATIRPEMLPLVSLDQAAIDAVVATVAGGAPNVQDIYPLAPLQEGMLFHHLLGERGDPYILPNLLAFEDRASLDRFVETVQTIIDRHDILRTALVWQGLPEPVQVVYRNAPMPVQLASCDPAGGDVIEQLKAAYNPRRYRMDVSRAPLLHGFAARDDARERWLLLILAHHLVVDHATLDLLVQEAELLLDGRGDELPPPLPFRTFVAQARAARNRHASEGFFRELLGDISEPTTPFDLTDVQGDGQAISEARTLVAPELSRALRERARALGVSVGALLHVGWGLVVARTTGRRAVVFGTVMFGRLAGGRATGRVLGLFINTLPIRLDIGDEGVAVAVRRAQGVLAQLIRHEAASLSLAQRCSGVPPGTPLFSSLLNYRRSGAGDERDQTPAPGTPAPDGAAGGLESLWSEERTNYPVTLSVDDLGQELMLTAQVASPVAAQRVCAMMERALGGLAEALERAPETPVRAIEVLPPAERKQVLEAWNATAAAYPATACIHELIAAQAERTPDAVALDFEGQQLTYGDLEARAARLARRLREIGVRPGARVAVCAERSIELVVGLLAAMKAGGAYVPLDPTYPTQRLAEMLADCAPAAALTHSPARHALEAAVAHAPGRIAVVDLETDLPAGGALDEGLDQPGDGVTSRDLAYVIYTSGSTGKPKGAMNEHRAVVNRLVWLQRHWELGAGDVFLQKTPFTFDVSVGEIFCPLISGSRLVIARPEGHKDPGYLAEVIEGRGVNVVHFVPSMLQLFLEHEGVAERCRGLRRVMCSGEALP
ncbi:MAG TPA: AMP-binding protein, partial [Polyangia bacterium]|nr:AMP-binding protein [Polyangia bacterium]